MSCVTEAIRGPGGGWNLSATGVDTLVEEYQGDSSCLSAEDGQVTLVTEDETITVGQKYIDGPDMGCRSITMAQGKGDLCNFTVTWVGFYTSIRKGDKRPTGGLVRSTVEEPIQTHPNYKASTAWGTVFGEGPSPNPFGRYEVEAGIFSHFGPLPDNQDDREDTLAGETREAAEKLRGIEAFVTGGQPIYRYTILTNQKWAPRNKQGQYFDAVHCKLIPCPISDDHTWLLTSITEDAEVLWDTYLTGQAGVAWRTTLEFTRSAFGGWNPLLYKSGGNIDLDDLSR